MSRRPHGGFGRQGPKQACNYTAVTWPWCPRPP